jgi:hypothetical protein
MRIASMTMVAACLLAAGCKSENELRYTATLQAETSGVAMSDDGLDGFAAMSGTTCTIDVNWGCPTDDEDLPTEQEQVVDHLGHQTIGVSPEGMHSIVDGKWNVDADIPVVGLRTANLTLDGGHVLLGGDTSDCWIRRDDGSIGAVPGEVCADDARHTVDRATGTMFVASGGLLFKLAKGEAKELSEPGDLVAWDSSLHLLYTADSGTENLRALDPDGVIVWEADTKGPIRDIAARGDRGEVLVLMRREDGLGGMERRDGETGRLLGRSTLPTDDGTLTTSLNGVRIAVIRSDEVHFFALETDGEEPVVDTTPPTCIDPMDRAQRD